MKNMECGDPKLDQGCLKQNCSRIIVYTHGGSHELVLVLISFGAISSADTHSRYFDFVVKPATYIYKCQGPSGGIN